MAAIPASPHGSAEIGSAAGEQQAAAGQREDGAERRAHRADEGALERQQGSQPAPRDTERAQQREFLRSPRRLQRQRREDEEGAGAERDQGERVEVHAIGPCDLGRASGDRGCRRDHDPRREQRRDLRAPARRVGPGLQAHLDARQHSRPAEMRLRRGDVDHHGIDARLETAEHAGHLELACAASCHQPQAIALAEPEPRGRPGREPRNRRIEQARRVSGTGRRGARNERRLHRQRAQGIEAENAHAAGTRSERGIQLEDGTCGGDVRACGDAREKSVVEAAARAADLELGLAREGARGTVDLGERRGMDGVHGTCERNAERDAGEGEREAQAV
jgi:hypothetical protein